MSDDNFNALLSMVAGRIKEANEKTDEEDKDSFKKREVSIARKGTKIILPADPRDMSEDEAIAALQKAKEEKTRVVGIHEEFDCYPLEGAWAMRKVCERLFGYVLTGDVVKSFMGDRPGATFVKLEVAPGVFEQVLWGNFEIPGMTGQIMCGADFSDGAAKFVIHGKATIKDKEMIEDIAEEMRSFLKTNSLYKGKAIKIKTKPVEDRRGERFEVDFENPPSFMDLKDVTEDQLIFSDDVRSLIRTNLFTPIEKTDACRAARIPLKRSILLEGPYGTGKTLTAFVTARKAVDNAWTFIYMDRAQALRDVLIFARKYAPVVIFCEDIEQVTSGGRTTDTNDVLNNIDGIDSKGHEVLCIFTTNHVEKIEPAMLRAGRLDAVITVLPPDEKAAERLVRSYSSGLLAPSENLKAACKELRGQIPAFIREVVERAKLFAISRLEDGQALSLSAEDIRIAAVGMKRHFALVNRPKTRALTGGDKLALALVDVLGNDYNASDASTQDEYSNLENALQHRGEIDAQNLEQ
jgi:transitional endoplasmic reticulum ATPase